MKYDYEDLSDGQFEQLVVCLCQHLLGIRVQGFSKGPDGGRDAKFVGTCEMFPSKSSPWTGTIIIQAKHTNGFNKHFSDSDFYSKEGSSGILNKEVASIKKLREANELDYYMLFSNRRLSGIAENDITTYIAEECDIPKSSIFLCGVEQLEMWLKRFPDVPEEVNLDPLDSPLIVSPDDLSEVIEALAKQQLPDPQDNPPTPRTPYQEKNRINNMSEEYANEMKRKYLKETAVIDRFLSDPINSELLERYKSTIDEFQLEIIGKREDYPKFDNLMSYLFKLLFNRDPVLRKHRRLTRAVLFYMYWNCDIGRTENAEPNQALTS